jgi:hypothetical protein
MDMRVVGPHPTLYSIVSNHSVDDDETVSSVICDGSLGDVTLDSDVLLADETRLANVGLGSDKIICAQSGGMNAGRGLDGAFPTCFVRAEINGHEVEMLLDTGSPLSILSIGQALRCGLAAHIPVNHFKAVGILWNVPITIARIETRISLFVMTAANLAVLGLNWLCQHRAIIDMKTKVLIIEGTSMPLILRY